MRKLALIGLTALLVGALPVTSARAVNGNSCWTPQESEKAFVQEMNASRAETGAGALKLDPELSQVARVHTGEMVRANKLHHTPMKTFTKRVTEWVTIGENVGAGESVETLHTAFMGSPTHKDNILLKSYRHVGVGTKQVGDKLWVTVVFEARTNPGTTLAMPSC